MWIQLILCPDFQTVVIFLIQSLYVKQDLILILYDTGLIVGLQPANEKHHYKVTPSLIDADPTTSSFSTWHMALIELQDETRNI